MINEKAIVGAVIVLVLAAFVVPSISGFAVASECSGTPLLHLTPNPAQAGQLVTASVTGLKNCYGAEVLIKEGSTCGGVVLASYDCKGISCSGSTAFTFSVARDYIIAACIDRDEDGYFLSQNEKSSFALKVTSLPDLAIANVLLTPKTAYAGDPIVAAITVENKGITAMRGFTINYEVFREGAPKAFYTYNIRNEETSGISYFRQYELQPGESKEFRMPAISVGAGTYKIKITLDAEKRYNEFDETNNIYETTLTVL